ncbi:MAG: HNH endonuclease [Candidatus Bathyarchaeota archaeon]|nr:HNH endonuclease [Candidatus Bathyarchaeota archaeon]
MPSSKDFEHAIAQIFKSWEEKGKTSVTITSGTLHRRLGEYPGSNHRLPACCSVMKKIMKTGDEIISQPPSGQGATLKIKYRLPR